jgi:glutamate---cysteine ligase / carboxylate-amine ligase
VSGVPPEPPAGAPEPDSEPTKPAVGPPPEPLGLFQAFGVEIEWMIVDAESLDVRPSGDAVLGEDGEVDRGRMAWSNELVLHVLEAKTNGPAASLDGLDTLFHAEALEAEARLAPLGCRLLSGAAHPWMDPDRETRIWPHEYTEVYRAFDRIFGVRGHGWANLQSTHLNLPFSGDAEFAALHQAIRPVLALIPAIAAASPVLDGVVQPNLCERMERYRTNSRRVPAVAGGLIPEVVRTRRAYEGELLAGIYRDLAPLDPEGTLRHEWVNARGAIARFQRGAIEIRVIDAQEAPVQDLAVLRLVVTAVRRLAEAALAEGGRGATGAGGAGGTGGALERPATDELRALLAETTRVGERAALAGPRAPRSRREALAPALDLLGVATLRPRDAGELWAAVAEVGGVEGAGVRTLLEQGPLARRLLRALGEGASGGAEPPPGFAPSRAALRECWEEVADAFRGNRAFRGA